MPGLLHSGGFAMRVVPSFHLSFPDVRALRIALASGAAAGLVVIAACTDTGGKTITAPSASQPRNATISSGGFGHAKLLTLCVDASSPGGTYTFKNIHLNRNQSGPDGPFPWTLDGNGVFPGDGFWYDVAVGGDGTTVANADTNIPYTLAAGGCVDVLTRTVGDAVFMASLPAPDGPCTVNCGGKNDSFAAANISFISNSLGAVFDHIDCIVDNGDLMPQHVNPTTGSPPVPIVPWPQNGFDGSAAFTNYGCGSSNVITRGFVNFEHGTTITYFFSAPTQSTAIIAPTATTCEDYAKNTASSLDDILAGFKSNKINSMSPGVFFYYATVTKGAGESVSFSESISPNAAGLPPYEIQQTQAYLYTFAAGKCTTAATLTLSGDHTSASGGGSLAAGTYILGVKYATDAPKGTTVSSALQVSGSLLATNHFIASVNGSSVATTTAAVDTKAK